MTAADPIAGTALPGGPIGDSNGRNELPLLRAHAAALAQAKTSVHLSEYVNETSAKTTWHVPKAHYLECWGDARTWDGTWTIQQPLILPLYGGVSTIEFVAQLLGEGRAAEQLVREGVEAAGGQWRASVHDGYVAGSTWSPAQAAVGTLRRRVTARRRRGRRRSTG